MIEVFWVQQIFSTSVAKFKSFVEAPSEVAPPTTSEPGQEEDVLPPVIDPVLLSLVHQSMTQH